MYIFFTPISCQKIKEFLFRYTVKLKACRIYIKVIEIFPYINHERILLIYYLPSGIRGIAKMFPTEKKYLVKIDGARQN